MDIKAYIASGVLELYVLDQLAPLERREVEHYALQYPEVKTALNEIEVALFAFASATAKSPKAELEEKIIKNVLAADNVGGKNINTNQTVNNWLIVLSALGIIGAAIFAWFYSHEKNSRLAAKEKFEMAQDSCDLKEADILYLESVLDQVFLEDSKIVPMAGTDSQPESRANVIYNQSQQTVLLETNNLPKPDNVKQFQLWGIVDGKPVDLGVFDIPNSDSKVSLITMKFVENVQAFAVTLEPVGGSAAPSMDEMWVIGNVES